MANYSQRYNASTQTTTAGAFKFDTISSVDWPVAKLIWGAEGVATYASAADPLPVTVSGVATAANQTTANGLLTTIDGDTGTIATHAATIAGAVSGTEMQVDIVSSALPTGAATAAKQPALGTAGTASADVISIQGIASMTPIQIADNSGSITVDNAGTFAVQVDGAALTALQKIDDPVIVDDAAFTPATSSVNVAGFVFDDTTPDSVDEGDAGAARMSANRCQYIQIRDGASGNEFGVAVTTSNELMTDNNSIHSDNSGLNQVTAIGATRDSDGNVRALMCTTSRHLKVSVEAATANIAKAEDAAHTTGDTGVFMLGVRSDTAAATGTTDGDYSALIVDSSGRLHVNVGNTVTVASHAVTNAGTFAVQVDGSALTALQKIDDPVIVDDAAFTPATSSVMMAGFQADESSTDSVDEGDGGAARMTLDRKIITTPQPHTQGGLSIFRSLDLDETEEEVKASAGQVYGGFVTNTTTGTLWLKFYNATAANVTVGTTTPVITWGIQGNATDDIAAILNTGGMGIAFDTAITVACTTGFADNDTGAPAANAMILNLFYK